MRKYNILLILVVLTCAVFAVQVNAESFTEAFTLFQPMFSEEGHSPWELTKDQTVYFASQFQGFKCRGLRTTLGTEKYYCTSEKNAYTGQYVMVFDFGYSENLLAAEIQISHPDLDMYLENSSNYMAWLSAAEEVVKEMDGLEISINQPEVKDPYNHIFYELETVPYSNTLFNNNIMFSTGFLEKGKSRTNTLVLVFSHLTWFWENQIIYKTNPDTGELETHYIAY